VGAFFTRRKKRKGDGGISIIEGEGGEGTVYREKEREKGIGSGKEGLIPCSH